ncbi:MAG: diacylglycerol kinase (ATP) [Nitriliruptoraceae bacterium]|jgi:diacylglycerol kinase (ATP)
MTTSPHPTAGDSGANPHGPMLLIANPRSGKGRNAALAEATAALDAAGAEYSVQITQRAGHAIELARDAVTNKGIRYVVAVGGDGTVHEVVNGLVDPETGLAHASDLVLGVIPGGSGSDFVKTWGLDIPIPRLVANHLVTAATMPLDVGRVRFHDARGSERVRLFANIAECGWGGDVTRRANALPRFVGQARYLMAILASTARLKSVEAEVVVDHTTTTEAITELVVANGQFFGSGIKVAPRALPDDGIFNVQTWRGGVRDLLENLPKARAGEHLSSATVREWQSTNVHIDAATPMTLEADGEVLGQTPATFDVLHRVLQLSA